jgi:glycosyltransferase involved in cell wall biosynthesis
MTSFSVVICTYNRADRVGRAINSVLNQTFEDLELIVVDDGSIDNTAVVVATFDDPRMHYVRRDNGGLSAARNTGVAHATGRYVTFLDDDDEALPAWLARFHGALAGDDAVVTCAAYAVDVRGRTLRTISPHQLGPAYEGYRALFLPGTFALPRLGYDEVGGFAEGVHYCHHSEFALRLLPYCFEADWPVRVIEEPLLRWEVRPPPERPETMPEKVLIGMNYLLTRHGDRLGRSPGLLADTLARAGVAAARLGEYRDARRYLARAARAQPRRGESWLRLGLACVRPLGDVVWKTRVYRSSSAGGLAKRPSPS